MAKNFVQVGKHLTLPVESTVASGDVVQVGSIVGVALNDAWTDDETTYYATVAIDGVWSVPVTGLTAGAAATVNGIALGYATEDSGDEETPVLIVQGL